MKMLEPAHAGETLLVEVTVAEGGAPADLSAASAAAAALDAKGARVAGTVDASGAAAGAFVMEWAAGALGEGLWTLQLRALHPGGRVEHLAEARIIVKPTAFA